jgi:hypothetical protein
MERNMRKKSFYWIAQGVFVIFASSWATCTSYGQDLEKGKVEAAAQAGLVSGIGTHGSFAGTIGTAVTDHVFAFGEVSYIPLGGGTVNAFGFRSGGSAKAYGLNFGAQYLFRKSGSFAPYAGAGLEVLHSSVNYSSTVGGTTTTLSSSGTDTYLSLGGGVRYYVREEGWGFKPELMLFAGPNTYIRLGVGIFYQFGR